MKSHHWCKILILPFFLAIPLLHCNQSYAGKLDSVLQLFRNHKQNDTTKVQLLIATANAYRFTNPDSMLILADEGIDLAGSIGDQNGAAGCNVVKALAYLIFGEMDSALMFAREAEKTYLTTGDKQHLAINYFYMGAIYYNQSKFEKAIEYYKKTVALEKNSAIKNRMAEALDNIGITYSAIGNFSESLKYYLEGLKLREMSNDQPQMATSMGNIARVYASLGNPKMAKEYLAKSIAAQPGTGFEGLMINYENAGNVYQSIGDTANSIASFERAIQLADSAHQTPKLNRIMVNTAEVYLTMKEYDKAHELYKRCLANNQIPNSPAVDGMIHWGLGKVYVHKNRIDDGIREMETGIAIFTESGMKDQITEALRQLASAYGEKKDFANAYKTMNLYDRYRDSIFSDETKRKAQELQYEYDLQKKQTQIELLDKDKAISKSRAEKQNAVLVGLATVILLMVVILFILYRSRQRAKVANTLITRQAASLSNLNDYKDKIFSVLAHDLRGPIGSLGTSLGMLNEEIITQQEFNELRPMIEQQLDSVTVLLNNLLTWSVHHIKGGSAIKKEVCDLHKITTQNITLLRRAAEEKKIELHNAVPPGTTLMADTNHVDIIIRNLLSNALKFTDEGGKINVSLHTDDGSFALSVTDNGVGMTEAQLNKLFTASRDNSSSGTAGEIGIGLGLLMSYEFAKANNGTLLATSEINKGSTFTLKLPA